MSTYAAPYMPADEIAVVDAVFALKRPARVLEYGAGGSTVRWSCLPFVEQWLTVEHDPAWAQRVTSDAPKAELIYRDLGPADGYVHAADGPFDMILVDGRHRVACVQASPCRLAAHGVVLLHDASRPKYAAALAVYPHHVILTDGDGKANGLLLMWGE